MHWKISGTEKPLRGCVKVPADKSVSHRAVMYGSICQGDLKVKNFLFAEDCVCTLRAFRDMGCEITTGENSIAIRGRGLKGLIPPKRDIYLGNSGTSMRIMPGIISGSGIAAVLAGDASLSKRPMLRIVEPLRQMGARITTGEGGRPPLAIEPSDAELFPRHHIIPVPSAQVKSCLLAAGLYAKGTTAVTEPARSRDHTERMFKYLSADIEQDGLTTLINGPCELSPRDIIVPGDISSAAFFMVAASIIEGSDIVLKGVGLNPSRMGIIDVMRRMGADIEVLELNEEVEPTGDIRVKSSELRGTEVEPGEIPLLIDEIPVLVIAAIRAGGQTKINGIEELRVKESDRVKCMAENLLRMGYEIVEKKGSILIPGSMTKLKNSTLDSFGDHRIAMSMAVASLLAEGESFIQNTECVETSYPLFMKDLLSLLG